MSVAPCKGFIGVCDTPCRSHNTHNMFCPQHDLTKHVAMNIKPCTLPIENTSHYSLGVGSHPQLDAKLSNPRRWRKVSIEGGWVVGHRDVVKVDTVFGDVSVHHRCVATC